MHNEGNNIKQEGENSIEFQENCKFIAPSELSDPLPTESYWEDIPLISKVNSYKSRPLPSVFNIITEEQFKQRFF